VHKIILCGFSVLPTAELQCRVGKVGPTSDCITMPSLAHTQPPSSPLSVIGIIVIRNGAHSDERQAGNAGTCPHFGYCSM